MNPPVMKVGKNPGLFDHAPSAVFLIDPSGKILYANEQGAKRLGKNSVEVLGTILGSYFPPRHSTKTVANGD